MGALSEVGIGSVNGLCDETGVPDLAEYFVWLSVDIVALKEVEIGQWQERSGRLSLTRMTKGSGVQDAAFGCHTVSIKGE